MFIDYFLFFFFKNIIFFTSLFFGVTLPQIKLLLSAPVYPYGNVE